MGGGKYEGQGMMVGHRGEGEHGLLIIRQHGVEEQYSNVSSPKTDFISMYIIAFFWLLLHSSRKHSDLMTEHFKDGHDSMVVRQHNNQESHTDGIIVRHGQVTPIPKPLIPLTHG